MVLEKLIVEMVNNTHAGMVIINEKNEIIYSNVFFQQKIGYSDDELKGLAFLSNLIKDTKDRKKLIEKIEKCFEKPFDNMEVTMARKNGNELSVKMSGSGFTGDGVNYIGFVMHDVTSQRAFEKVIQAGYDNLQQTTIDLDEAIKKIKEQQILLENFKRKMTRELDIATNVQNAIIPDKFRSDSKLSIWGVSRPSEELGGDYFDFFQLDENMIGILIADVVGHGVPSALIATMLKAYFEYYTKRYRDPCDVFYHVNNAMSEILEDTGLYLTAFYSVLDLSKMDITSCSAGHDSALCFYAGEDQLVKLNSDANGTILGAFPDSEYESITSRLKPGCRLVFFTDGITEAKNEVNEFFGTDNLIEFITNTRDKTPEQTINGILTATDAFCGSQFPGDDRTMIVIDVLPEWQTLNKEKEALVKAQKLILEKNFLQAMEILKDLLKQHEKFTDAYILAGKTGILLNNYEDAEEYLKKAVDIDNNSYKGYYYLGITNFNQKQFLKAKHCWKKVKNLHGNYKKTDIFLAQVKQKLL